MLFADAEAGVVGAAHAGWKGALGGVTDATIAAMEPLGAGRERIAAAIGPCIARPATRSTTLPSRASPRPIRTNERFFADARTASRSSTSKPMSSHRLAAAGVGAVEALGLDTYADADRFYQLPPRDPSRRAGLWAPDERDRASDKLTLSAAERT